MGVRFLDGDGFPGRGWVAWTGMGGTEVPLSVGLDGMGYINPMDNYIVPSADVPYEMMLQLVEHDVEELRNFSSKHNMGTWGTGI